MSFDDRSTALIDLLEDLNESDLEYVLVGGYAVSAFNTRFSTDLDIVVLSEEQDAFVEFLEDRDFEETDSHAKEWVYETEVVEYEKRLSPQQPIGFDLLVNGLGVPTNRSAVVVRLPLQPQRSAENQRWHRNDHRSRGRRSSPRRCQTPQRSRNRPP